MVRPPRSGANINPFALARKVKVAMQANLVQSEPIWYQPVLDTPPYSDYSRKPAPQHSSHPDGQKPTDLREFKQILHPLDVQIREKFYKQHPWELARPKVAVEEDGADYSRYDWSKITQVGKQLDGESVVQRTLYLMKEVKDPVTRHREIHEFDASQARGEPLDDIPQGGNIPELIPESDAVIARWNEIQPQLEEIQRQMKMMKEVAEAIREEIRKEIQIEALKLDRTSRWIKKRLEHARRDGRYWREMLQKIKLSKPLDAGTRREKILEILAAEAKMLKRKLPPIEKEAQKMQRLSREVAYLQACSEFYLLRQQEEVEHRIAIEQATCFGREMGPTAHDKQFVKESEALLVWSRDADRMAILTSRKRQERKKRQLEVQADAETERQAETPLKGS